MAKDVFYIYMYQYTFTAVFSQANAFDCHIMCREIHGVGMINYLWVT
jgi:hypothetical protein